MEKEKLLEQLQEIPFTFIWPESGWEDVGFTERRIWVSPKGYGYVSCDEPNSFYKFHMENDDLKAIIEQATNGDLEYKDIKNTPIAKIDIIEEYEFEDDDIIEIDVESISCSDGISEVFCQAGWGDVWLVFFDSKESLIAANRRESCDTNWDELSIDEIRTWIMRLKKQDLSFPIDDIG